MSDPGTSSGAVLAEWSVMPVAHLLVGYEFLAVSGVTARATFGAAANFGFDADNADARSDGCDGPVIVPAANLSVGYAFGR